MKKLLTYLTLFLAVLSASSAMAEGTGSVRTFQSGLRFEESEAGFLHSITVDGEPRLTTFHPEKKEASTGAAWQMIQLRDGARALVFDLYGGSGEVLLLGEGDASLATEAKGSSDLVGKIMRGDFGPILHRSSGPLSVDEPIRVRWDLRPTRGEELTLAFLDDRHGDWGFVETGPIRLISDNIIGDPLPAEHRNAADRIVSLDPFAETVLMPAGADWGHLGGPFFKRRLFRGRLPFLTSYLPDSKTRSTGATWLPVRLKSDSAKLSLQVRGGRGRLLLLRGCHDFSRHPNISSLAREVDFDLKEQVVAFTTGREQPEAFQEITWTVDKRDGEWLTLLVLDELRGEWGYLDVSSIRVIPN